MNKLEEFNILTKKVTKHNNTSCHILMPNKFKDDTMLVMSLETLEFITGRKFERK